ncbi:hypothetical protein [Clostridium weizhouense]|nr:hypothetical protein [Clostridium weizhouense]
MINKSTSDVSSRNYPKKINNEEHQKSPYGKNEPSPRTTYK